MRKPFGTHEFLARVRAAVRRSQAGNGGGERTTFSMDDLEVYPKELRAQRGEESIDLSPRELGILTLLHERAGEAVHRDDILDRCWGIEYYPESRTLDQHIAKLRKRVEVDVSAPRIIETVRGVGYRFQPGR